MAKPISFTTGGKRWRLSWGGNPTLDGEPVDGLCNFEKRKLTIRGGLKPLSELDTLIHELSHACHEYLHEDAIDPKSTDIARVLWRCGYRKLTTEQRRTLEID